MRAVAILINLVAAAYLFYVAWWAFSIDAQPHLVAIAIVIGAVNIAAAYVSAVID